MLKVNSIKIFEHHTFETSSSFHLHSEVKKIFKNGVFFRYLYRDDDLPAGVGLGQVGQVSDKCFEQ